MEGKCTVHCSGSVHGDDNLSNAPRQVVRYPETRFLVANQLLV